MHLRETLFYGYVLAVYYKELCKTYTAIHNHLVIIIFYLLLRVIINYFVSTFCIFNVISLVYKLQVTYYSSLIFTLCIIENEHRPNLVLVFEY